MFPSPKQVGQFKNMPIRARQRLLQRRLTTITREENAAARKRMKWDAMIAALEAERGSIRAELSRLINGGE